jgi:uncharacterized membrane protein
MKNVASMPSASDGDGHIGFTGQMMGGMASEALGRAESKPAETDKDPGGKSTSDSSVNNRKIIYQSELRINVEDFDGIDTKLNELVNQSGGFVSNAKIDRMQGKQRYGQWQIRVPVSKYQSFMNSVGDIGAVVSRNEDASDVTAEFYDLEARIKNKQRLEERIAGLLDQAKGELKRLIDVEKELARVREEIERMEGRKRYLSDVTALTTIDVYITEVKNYVPEQTASFSDRISNAWNSAVDQSTEVAQGVIVGLVRNAINIAVFIAFAVVVWLIYRVIVSGRARTAA